MSNPDCTQSLADCVSPEKPPIVQAGFHSINLGRLVVVETVYHQPVGGQPTPTESRFERMLKSDEQPYVRRLKVGPEWQQLDCGWVKCAGMLIVSNPAPRFATQPTPEDRELESAKVVELTYSLTTSPAGPCRCCWLILPGESMRAQPSCLELLRLRCQKGTTVCTVTVIPE